MKNIKKFASKSVAEGQEVKTPFTGFIEGQTKIVYGGSLLGETVLLFRDDNDNIICTISEPTIEEYVDLGLPSGKKWASCNLGATSPCEYGNYYAWGETAPKDSYTEQNYLLGEWTRISYTRPEMNELTGDIEDVEYDYEYEYEGKYSDSDNYTQLEDSDDAVYVATNGEAHMPTKYDLDELLNNTNYSWCTCTTISNSHSLHNINGILFVNKTDNSKKIFIPGAGSMRFNTANGNNINILSSTLYPNNEEHKYESNLMYKIYSSMSNGQVSVTSGYRWAGYSVRGVKD